MQVWDHKVSFKYTYDYRSSDIDSKKLLIIYVMLPFIQYITLSIFL